MTYTYQYPHMAVTVDLVLFDTSEEVIKVLLIKRGNEPFKEGWALPGGYVDMKERIEIAAKRELTEETGAKIDTVNFLGFYDQIDRDPRERTISFAFWSKTKMAQQNISAADDASDAKWFELNQLPALAFDHATILADAIAANSDASIN